MTLSRSQPSWASGLVASTATQGRKQETGNINQPRTPKRYPESHRPGCGCNLRRGARHCRRLRVQQPARNLHRFPPDLFVCNAKNQRTGMPRFEHLRTVSWMPLCHSTRTSHVANDRPAPSHWRPSSPSRQRTRISTSTSLSVSISACVYYTLYTVQLSLWASAHLNPTSTQPQPQPPPQVSILLLSTRRHHPSPSATITRAHVIIDSNAPASAAPPRARA
jgi:hypothetical protein